MNINYFRKLYEYHFALNRKLWERSVMALDDDQFVQDLDYSVGSIRNQTVHMMSVDRGWFVGLRDKKRIPGPDPADYPTRAKVRAEWDTIEATMRDYLASLDDEQLAQPFIENFDVWEVLFHVLNHGTDHRAQLLAMLHSLGVPTFEQDYIFFARGEDV